MKVEKPVQNGILTFLYGAASEGLAAFIEFSSIHTSNPSAQNKDGNDKKDENKNEIVDGKVEGSRSKQDHGLRPRQSSSDQSQ